MRMHAAFTMIELIFVIVILGILAGVALPKYLAMRSQSEDQVAKSFASTLTRTVGHSWWAASIMQGHEGTLKIDSDRSKFMGRSLDVYIDVPPSLDVSTVDFSQCVSGEGVSASPFLQHAAGYKLNIFCRDGNETDAPRFAASENSTYTF